MSPAKDESTRYYEVPNTARQAAVMALLIPYDSGAGEEWHITFIKRPVHPLDKHSGQISFPGGGMDDSDDTYQACALRETEEEVGIPRDQINVIGALTKLYVYASNNLVYPYVGYIAEPLKFTIQESEVERVITCPMSYFENESIVKHTVIQGRGYRLNHVPYYDLYGEILWGATAMMMSELVHLWKQIK